MRIIRAFPDPQRSEIRRSPVDINRTLALVVEYARRIWKYRVIVLITAWLVAIAGWAIVRLLPDTYDASAKVFVNAETLLKPLLEGMTVPTDPVEQAELITRALLSNPHMEAVARRTGLTKPSMSEAERDAVVAQLQSGILVFQGDDDQIYNISYSDHNPMQARKVVEVLLDDFISNSLSEDETQSADAQKFLQQQIAVYQQRMTEAENRLAEFKSKNMGLVPGSEGDYYERLRAAQAAVDSLQSQVRSATNRRNELASQLAGEEAALDGGTGTGGTTSVDATIAKLEAELAALRLRFTDKHPDVVTVNQTLKDLYRVREQELADRAKGGGISPGLSRDPVYRQLKMALSSADADLAGLRSQYQEKLGQMEYLRSMVNTIPEVEAQLNRLNRDYDVIKQEHDSLLKRLETARMSQQVNQQSQGTQFRVLDPPRTPGSPSSPDRFRLNSMVLAAALGAGIMMGFLLAQRDPIFYSADSLQEVAGLPVYGVIGIAGSEGAGWRDWRFELAAGGLLVLYVLVLMFGGRPVVA